MLIIDIVRYYIFYAGKDILLKVIKKRKIAWLLFFFS